MPTTQVQSEFGKICLFEDFTGPEHAVAQTVSTGEHIGPFRIIGDGLTDTDSGVVIQEASALNGVARLTATNEDKHCCGLATARMFDVSKMGTIVIEERIKFDDEATKASFMGLVTANGDALSFEDSVATASTNAISYVAANVVGFYHDSEVSNADAWYGIYTGGTTAAVTTISSLELSSTDSVSNTWQILKLEVDTNGTARWYVDNSLKMTVSGAASVTEDLAALTIVANKANTSTTEDQDLDYFSVKANRCWDVTGA
jgi:hypothetical protein